MGIAVEYLKTIGDAAPRGARMLLAEYVKFLLHRGKYYFPDNLPAKVVAASPKEGKIDRRLAIPLEDLSTGWKQAGQVGQEVYGSSVSFVACVSAYLNYANAPIMVFCEYPILDDEGQFAPDGSGTIELCLGGTPELSCKVRVLPKARWKFCNEFRCKRKRTERLSSQPCRKTNRSLNTRYPVIRSFGSSSTRLRDFKSANPPVHTPPELYVG